MSSSIRQQENDPEIVRGLKSLYIIGGIAAFLQLVTIVSYSVALGMLGGKPASAEEYFLVQQSSKLDAVLRGDFLLLVLIGLYLGTFPALYAALRRHSPIYTALAVFFTILAVAGTFATESTFALLHLGDLYNAAATETQQALYLAAGEAVIAADMWNSSAAYMGGILLQGSGVMISVIMLRSRDFGRITAIAGLAGNALDLAQHLLHPFTPSFSSAIQMVMGPFYIVWFVMLGWDLIRLARNTNKAPSAGDDSLDLSVKPQV